MTEQGSFGGGVEILAVDHELRARAERDDFTVELEQIVLPQHAPRKMNGLAQVGAGRFRLEIWPKQIERLFTVQPMSRS